MPWGSRYSLRANEIKVDGMVLGFTLLLALLVAVLLSYAPRFVHETGLGSWLAGGGRSSGGRRRQRLQRSLVVAQIAVSVVLLTGAGLLVRTMLRLSEVDTGLNAPEVLTMEVALGSLGQNSAAQEQQFEQIRTQLSALPGVTDVGVGLVMPLHNSNGFRLDLKAEGHALGPNEPTPNAEYRTADPDYFRAAGIPIIKGRAFSATDGPKSARVVILNQTLADRLFPNMDPIGRRVAWTGEVLKFIGFSDEWRTVVGVAGDTKDNGLDNPAPPAIFLPFFQEPIFGGGFIVRAQNNAAGLAPASTRVIQALAPLKPIEHVMTVSQIRDESIAPRRLNAMLVVSFGILAVIIAAVGIAGVLAFSVSARTNEIGIRMSLGADSGMVQRMVLGEGGVLLVAGLALGVVGSALATKLLEGSLYGVPPRDPTTFAAVSLIMAAVGIAACWVPALRAARIQPLEALRAQ